MITKTVLQSVFYIKCGNGTGSAFKIKDNGKTFLVTARHVIASEIKGDELTFHYFYNQSWNEIKGKVLLHKDPKIDIAVIVLEKEIGTSFFIELGKEGMSYLSQDCLFLGFPLGFYTDTLTNDGLPVPFVKKGIISGFSSFHKPTREIYLDGQNNPGFSGGPVLVMEAGKDLRLTSVVSGYYQQNNITDSFSYHENSGIISSYSSRHIEEIII